MNEMKTLTLNGKTYDSFHDADARERLDELEQNGAVKTVNGIAPDANGNVEIPVSGGNADQSGMSAELKTALKNYFTNMQTLITQMAFSTDTHIGGTLIANAMAVVTALDNSEKPEQPESGIVQTGSILVITSGVTVNQIGAVLALA